MSLSCDELDYPTTVIEHGAHGIAFRTGVKTKGRRHHACAPAVYDRLISD
jgi:hypothetical protein